jgi:hypothetical protein
MVEVCVNHSIYPREWKYADQQNKQAATVVANSKEAAAVVAGIRFLVSTFFFSPISRIRTE